MAVNARLQDSELPITAAIRRGPQGAWVIFNDGHRGYYARRFYISSMMTLASSDTIEGENLDDVRARLPEGLENLGRCELDEPQVVETWA